ncbi:MAG TPA: hypothetical protein VHG69_06775 [Thermoleophilaceae bacterium]|nr:hypothetical protein [Thermoleophilaceae bacterium]
MGAILRLLAISASVVIALSFLLFATDEMDRGSKTQQQALAEQTGVPEPELAQVAPAPEEEAVRERQHSSLREAIDDANDVLLQPFGAVVSSESNWVTRGVPTLLGLLLYGIGLGLVANLLPGRQSHAGDWRTA